MRTKAVMITACCAIGIVLVSTNVSGAKKNNGIGTEIAGAGMATVLEQYYDNYAAQQGNSLASIIPQNLDEEMQTDSAAKKKPKKKAKVEEETTKAEQETKKAKKTDKKDTSKKEDKKETTKKKTEKKKTEKKKKKEKSFYDSIAISRVDNYVNVRSIPSTDGEILGKIYNNCAATIVKTEGDWYKIKSGSVTGYIKSEFFITGKEAEAVALEVGYVNATVTVQTLNVRDGQGTDHNRLTQLPMGGVFDVIQYGDGWVYLQVDSDIQGWVSMDYVNISVDFETAISIEEEKAKIEEEERLAREAWEAEQYYQAQLRAQQEAAWNAAAQQPTQAAWTPAPANPPVQAPVTQNETSNSLRQAISSYALQFTGNPYVYGGSSLTNGTDCSGFTMSVYNHFGYSLPHSSSAQSGNGAQVPLNSLLPGDLVFYTNGGSGIGHVALYIGNGQVVHASTPATGIKVSNVNYRTPVKASRIVN